MSTEVRLPELGENVTQGDLVRILVHVGDTIEKDQPIVELETEKAAIEVPAPQAGKVTEIRAHEGQKLKVGETILVLESNGAGGKKQEAKAAAPPAAAPAPARPAAAPEPPPQAAPTTPSGDGAQGGSKVEVKLPELGENVAQGDLTRFLVKVGDSVEKDQPIAEVETEKAVVEVPSPQAGKVLELKAREKQKIKIGETLLVLQSSGASAPRPEAPKPAPAQPVKGTDENVRQDLQAADRMDTHEGAGITAAQVAAPPPPHWEPVPAPKQVGPSGLSPSDVPAAPSVRQLAREIGVPITEVKGSGPGGRITAQDIKNFAKERAAAPQAAVGGMPGVAIPPLPDFAKWGPVERKPMSAVRRKTAQQMSYAWLSPRVTQFDKADITETEKLRKEFGARAEKAGGKLTMTAIALKVVAAALKRFPNFASSLDLQKEEIVSKRYYHVGVAVDTERGLLVPVIRDVDKKNIEQLAAELAQAAEKARNKKLMPEDMEGGVFTITNLGGIGGTAFTPIINAPEVAILGMSRSSMEPVYKDGQFVPRLMLPLSLAYDHRLIDGADAARFLRWVCEAFEQPFVLSLEG